MRRLLILPLLLALSLVLAPASMAEPDHGAAALFVLPWACGEGHVVTWDPEGHWEANKASGWAYDFRMSTGTPLYAPADGVAHFMLDERPFETNLGNYVDLVTLNGDWLIRMAHLRDHQTGRRQVRKGELIAHSGKSGVPSEHLHLELFVNDQGRWVTPDRAHLTRLFGLARTEFFEGAMLTNDTCATVLAVEGQVVARSVAAVLGTPQRLSVTLRNDSIQPMALDWLQVSLYSPRGLSQAVEIEGDWCVLPRDRLTVDVPALLEAPGEWYVGRVVVRSDGSTSGQPASGKVKVESSPVQVLAVAPHQAVYHAGDEIAVQVCLRNEGLVAWQADSLMVEGRQPDGTRWEATLDGAITLGPDESQWATLRSSRVPQQVGIWWAEQLGYLDDGQRFVMTAIDARFGLADAQLTLQALETIVTDERFWVIALVRNAGTRVATADRVEVWGWRPDGETSFVLGSSIGPLAPGQTTLLRFSVGSTDKGEWRLVDLGYWQEGTFYSVGLPSYARAKMSTADARR